MKKLLGTVVVVASLFVMSGIAIPFFSHQQEGVAFADKQSCLTNGGTWENDTCVKKTTTAVETKKDDIQKSTVTDKDRKLGYLSCGMWEFGCGMVNFLYWIFIIGGIINFTLRKVELHFMYPFLSCYTECHAEFIEA